MKYTQRNENIKNLRNKQGWTLSRIAEKYNISRARVQQIIGYTGKNFRREWTKKIAESGKYATACQSDLRDGNLPGLKRVWMEYWGENRHPIESGYGKVGQEFEERASKILLENGIENIFMPNHHSFDILTSNNKKIDVKSTNFNAENMPSQKYASPTFVTSKIKSGKDCDFFFIFVPYENDYTYFIIPSYEVSNLSSSSRIRIPWPQMGRKPSKWHKYHKRLDLLEMD